MQPSGAVFPSPAPYNPSGMSSLGKAFYLSKKYNIRGKIR